VLAYGTFVPLMKIGCCLILLFVKSICTDLDSLSFIRHFLDQIVTLLTADCSFLLEISMVSLIAITAVSSANVRGHGLKKISDDSEIETWMHENDISCIDRSVFRCTTDSGDRLVFESVK
jgi:hypothetical protein